MAAGGLKFEFAYQRLDASLKERIQRCVDETVSSEAYSAMSSAFGKLFCCPVGEYVMVPLLGDSRPPERKMIAVARASGKRYDLDIPEDYSNIGSALGIKSDIDGIAYYLTAQCDFAFVDKGSMPVAIANDTVAESHGFTLLHEERAAAERGVILVWQRWGGILYSCEFCQGKTRLIRSLSVLREGIGDLRSLPIYLSR